MSRLRTLEKDREPTGWQLLWRIKETRQAILITVGLLIVYRVLLNIPLPGVSTTPDFIRQNIPPGSGLFNLLEFLSMLSGSSLLRVSALALGLLPYNVASALIYSSVQIIPGLRRMVEEDPRSARDRFERWNYYLAVPVAFFEAYLFLFVISPNCEGRLLILEGGAEKADALFVFTTMLILVTGSFVAVWISGLISEYGIQGQGNVILIATGIIGQIPNEIARLLGVQVQSEATVEFMGLVQKIPDAIRLLFVTPGKLETFIAYIILFVVCVIAIIYLLSGKRYIPVAYPDKRLNFRPFSRSMKFGARSTLPLSLTTGSDGFIGSQLLVAITSLYAPLATCSESLRINAIAKQVISVFGDKSVLFGPLAFFSVIFFTYFFANTMFQQQNLGERLSRRGAYIPGVESRAEIGEYLNRINQRITFLPALILGMLAIMPWVFNMVFGVNLSLLDSEKLIIIVGVVRDVVILMEFQIMLHGYQERLLIR